MGLDNYWSLKDSDKDHPKFSPPLNLCGGLFSEHGTKSFRGKVYSSFFEEELGLTLYREEILPKEIKEISIKLNSFVMDKSSKTSKFNDDPWSPHISDNEVKDLSRMFEAYADLNAILVGWW